MDERPTLPVHGTDGDGDEPLPTRRRGVSLLVVSLVAVVLVGLLLVVTDVPAGTVLGAVLLGLVILRLGWFLLVQFATPPPPPPDPGTLRRVRLTYRCPMCGTEVRMTSAASEDPEPPRHCMEDMELVASQE